MSGIGVYDWLKNNTGPLVNFEKGRLLVEQCFKKKIWDLYVNGPGVGKNRPGVSYKGLVLG